jgi:uncharacterized protein
MKIRLDSARVEPFSWQERLTFGAGGLELPEGVEIGPVEVDGTLSRSEHEFLLRARLEYRQRVPCDRCLTAVEEGVEAGLSLVVVERRGRAAEGGERQLGEDELGLLEVAGETLDTAPLVAEQVQLNLPARVLCREDCAGLCPRCGRNRNEGPCACPPPEPDPRWRGLGELKTKLSGRGTD